MQKILGVQVGAQNLALPLGNDQRSIDRVEQAGGNVEIDSRIGLFLRAFRPLQAMIQAHNRFGTGFDVHRHIYPCSSAPASIEWKEEGVLLRKLMLAEGIVRVNGKGVPVCTIEENPWNVEGRIGSQTVANPLDIAYHVADL